MRFSLTKAALALAALGTAIAQDPSSSGPRPSSASSTPRPSSSGSANTNQTVLTTTITSFMPQGSGQSSAVPLTLTLTLNSTSPQAINETIANATMSGNDTLANGTVEWQEGDDWIPFNIIIDPAYGVLGALLILSGIPLAVLGGKNRCLAITTGYALMVFTLVMILALGVSPALQPPSPKPPTQLLRGLYLLACVLSAFVGAGLGVFLYKLAKYWVNAAGGFALAWYILALRPGGTIENVIGRWGLIGGMSVGAFIAGLPNPLNPYLVLLSTAWIGATAFILGVDCFTRAGLKEFYVFNLGFWNLFPKLNGKKYPLTQTMAIELGILASVFLIGAAIQFRILNILQKRMKHMQEEEEARVDAEEVGKAAERFKNLEAEHAEWEEKYGSTSGGGGPSSSASGLGHKGDHSLDTPGAVDLPELQFSRDSNDKRFSSTHSLLSQTERQRYEPVGQSSPTTDTFPPQSQYQAQRNRSRTRLNEMDTNHAEELVGDGDDKADPALEEQMKLLEEVQKARLEVRSSLDKLRSSTPTALSPRDGTHSGGSTPTMDRFANGHARQLSNASSNMLGRPVSILQRASPTSPGFPPINTATSDQLVPPKSEWEQYVSNRNIVSPAPVASGAPSMHRQSSYDGNVYAHGGSAAGSRPGSAMGMKFGGPQDVPLRERRQSSQTMPIAMARPTSNYDLRRPTSQYDLNRPVSQYETPVQQQRASYAPGTIIGSAAGPKYTAVTPGAGMTDGYSGRPAAVPRAMTYEELSDRHRKRMTQMQNPVSSKMNEEIELAAAKEKWEKQRRQEREMMRRREAEKMQLVKEREQEAADAGRQGGIRGGAQRGKGEVMKSTDEWRRSVAGNLGQYAPQQQPQQLVHASSSAQIRGQGHGEVPRSPQRAARQQEEIKYGTAGRRRQSSHIAN